MAKHQIQTYQLQNQIETLEQDVETRNNAIMALQRNFESVSQLLKNEKNESFKLNKDLVSCQSQLKQTKDQVYYMEQKIREQEGAISRLKVDISGRDEEIKSLQKMQEDFLKMKQTIRSLENTAQQKSIKNKDLEQQIEELNKVLQKGEQT